MSITYSYEIVAVNEAARCMEIVYTAEGHQTMHIGARLPYEGETVEQIVRMYEPVRYWEEQQLVVVLPEIGTAGTIRPIPVFVMPPIEPAEKQPTVEGAQTL
jgi:hypothetical protein